MARDIELVIKGRDVGATRTMRRVGNAMRKAAKDAETADEKLTNLGKKLGKASLRGIAGLGKVSATVAAVASSVGPAVSGLLLMGKAIAGIGAGVAKVAPLVTILPAIAASLALVVGTIKLAAPEMGRQLMPIADAFRSIQGEIGRLASDGLRKVAREFVRVNFPVIAKGMREIARDVNLVVKGMGQWANSAEGQHTIRELVEATSDATEQLDGRILRLGVSFGNMLGRIGRAGIERVTALLVKLSEAGIRWLDSIDRSDIDGAFKSLGGWGIKLRDTFYVLRDIGTWMAENEEQVKRFSDIAAGLAIALGAATGNWLAVLAGAASISVNHWDEIKKVTEEGGKKVSGALQQISEDPNVAKIKKAMKQAWTGFKDSFKEATDEVEPKWKRLVQALKLAWEEWAPILHAWWEGVGKPVFSALGTALGFLVEHVITSVTVSTYMFQLFGEALRQLWAVASRYLGMIINGLATVFQFVPGIGPILRKAADDFNDFRDRVNTALSGIHDEDVRVNLILNKGQVGITGSNESFNVKIGRRAHGGFVQKGRPYLVGERGVPEVFTPNADGRVQSTIPSGGAVIAGGPAEVHLRIESGGSTFDDLLVEVLKRAIRDRGGNVQAVLGRA